ncbi:DegT/DnrJ/EryC1/StrS family aminotransferase [Paludibacterium purpuratum]|uniref:UDP-2-acetamido-2-deoxy-ribo-hexuluronate aminotransferase n=1 Tax=Paludibacterium purpuratum TaxID=1144873 RepID=A0A4R7B678_9NEIS|nr:DegT/DnrJ/EryC1/StrS family aminotransferase [Paludibacterium purpuratum]TDR80184.1 UDP-2-acetamido-2-deoxy-ribo-hexuluronate aminotransferase [Paludibacterium purpuratum]
MSIQFIDLKAQYQHLKPAIDARIQSVLDHGQYIMGPEVAELEAQLAAFVGVKHAIGVSDGTTALQVALMALGVGPGDEVITTPFTFIATGEMIALLGATPVFVDIDPDTYNLDPALIEAAITPRTRAIIPVSLYGQCADFDAINAVAERHGLAVIEDGAQSFGARYKDRRSCGATTIATTSFFPSKPLGCYGDGGACFTNDDELARKMRQIRVHGQDRRYHHPVIGINGRLDTLQAAVLLAKLPTFEQELAARARIGARYNQLLGGVVRTQRLAEGCDCVYAQYTIEVDRREAVQAALKEAGVPTAVHYPVPLNLQPAFAHLNQPAGSFPRSEAAAQRVMSLPMHPFLDEATQDAVVEAVKRAIG